MWALLVDGEAVVGVLHVGVERGVEEAELETAQELRNLRAEIAELRAELNARSGG